MAPPVRHSDDLIAFTQYEVELYNRALANQATPWASIGQLIARLGIYDGLPGSMLQEQDRLSDVA